MAWYYGTYSCGHEGRVNVIGKTSERQAKIDKHFEGICEECWKKEMEKRNQQAIDISRKYDFPELTGTEKQIKWANSIRLSFYERCENKGISADNIINAETTAKFWIDNTSYLGEHFVEEYNEKKQKEYIKRQMINDDAVKPNDVKYDGVVEIIQKGNKILLKYEKNKDFIDLVKSLKYRWNDVWYRELSETTGAFTDRAAEIGHKLLKNGFAICIHDKEISQKAVDGNYEEEHTRWILSRTNTNLLVIRWGEYNKEIYKKAKDIGGKWSDSTMTIDISHYQAVEKFAEENDFKFTKAAIEKIEDYKEQYEKVKEVKVNG